MLIYCTFFVVANKYLLTYLLTYLTRGKFILPNLQSIGKIVESFAFKIYHIVVCL